MSFIDKRDPDYDGVTSQQSVFADRLFGVVDIETFKDDEGVLVPCAIG